MAESSWIADTQHSGNKLTVHTKSGKSYTFKDVPASLHEEMQRAKSKGEFLIKTFAESLRNYEDSLCFTSALRASR